MPQKTLTTHYGIDMTGEEKNAHFRHMKNLFRNHQGDGTAFGAGRALERIAGFRRALTLPAEIHTLAVTADGEWIVIHAGKRLYMMSTAMLPNLPRNDADYQKRRGNTLLGVPLPLVGVGADGKQTYVSEFLPEHPISIVPFGDETIICDGARLYSISSDGFAIVTARHNTKIGDVTITSLRAPYVPTVMKDGVAYEQRNILTDRYRQTHTFNETSNLDDGNAPLIFERIADSAEGVARCRVVGMLDGDFGDTLVIPDSTRVGGISCAISELAPDALADCPYQTVVLPNTLRTLPNDVLKGCQNVTCLRVPIGVRELHLAALSECAAGVTVEYAGSEAQWEEMAVVDEGFSGTYTLVFGFKTTLSPYGIRLAEESITRPSISFDGKAVRFYPLPSETDAGVYDRIMLLTEGDSAPYGKTVTLDCTARPFYYGEGHILKTTEGRLKIIDSATPGNPDAPDDATPEGASLVYGCQLATLYDRRIFFSGLPAIPDVIFYSHEDDKGNPIPSYIGVMNYQTDSERMAVRGLYAAEGDLLVLHANRYGSKLVAHEYALPDTASSLFLRLYPSKATYGIRGVADSGVPAYVFGGRLHILTKSGLYRLERTGTGETKRLVPTSSRIAPALNSVKKGKALFASLGTYLALFYGGKVYLGDSQMTTSYDGNREYEWYPLEEIGSHKGDKLRYRALTKMPAELISCYYRDDGGDLQPLTVSEEPTEALSDEVHEVEIERRDESGAYTFAGYAWVKNGSGALYDTDGRYAGGEFCAPSAAITLDGTLVFGTKEGAICAFNTDIALTEDAPPDAYYLFDGHQATASFTTFPQSLGTETRRKRTLPGSACIMLRPMADSKPTLTVHLDGRDTVLPLPSAPFDFTRLAFDVLGFIGEDTVRHFICERRDYVTKSYTLESDEPFAFLGLSYEYTERN